MQLLKQLGIDRQILQQLVDEEAMVAESRKQGITVSDVEIRERILALPGFQENGRFVGEQRYRQLLQFQNPPMTTAEFETQPAPRAADREAAQRAHRLDVGQRRRRRRRVPPPQREGEARRRAGHGRGVQGPGAGDRRRAGRALREVERQLPHRREAQDQVRDRERRSGARNHHRARRRHCRRSTSRTSSSTRRRRRCAPATSCFKLEGKDEKQVQALAEDVREEGQGAGRRFRRARQAVFRGREQQHATAAISTTSAAAAWWPSSSRRRSR